MVCLGLLIFEKLSHDLWVVLTMYELDAGAFAYNIAALSGSSCSGVWLETFYQRELKSSVMFVSIYTGHEAVLRCM